MVSLRFSYPGIICNQFAMTLLVCILNFPLPTVLGDTPAQEYVRLAFDAMSGLRNYEVHVKEWQAFFPRNAEDQKELASGEKTTHMRILFDREAKQALIVRREAPQFDKTEVAKLRAKTLVSTNLVLYRYVNGTAYTTVPQKGTMSYVKSLDEFFLAANFPAIELAGIEYPLLAGKRANLEYEQLVAAAESGRTRTLGDGQVWVTFQRFEANNVQHKYVLDKSTLYPKEVSITVDNRGDKLTKKQSVTYNERNGIALPVHVAYDRVRPNVRRDNKAVVLMDVVGTVDIEWLQVNETKLMFPDEKKFADDITVWADYLKILN